MHGRRRLHLIKFKSSNRLGQAVSRPGRGLIPLATASSFTYKPRLRRMGFSPSVILSETRGGLLGPQNFHRGETGTSTPLQRPILLRAAALVNRGGRRLSILTEQVDRFKCDGRKRVA